MTIAETIAMLKSDPAGAPDVLYASPEFIDWATGQLNQQGGPMKYRIHEDGTPVQLEQSGDDVIVRVGGLGLAVLRGTDLVVSRRVLAELGLTYRIEEE